MDRSIYDQAWSVQVMFVFWSAYDRPTFQMSLRKNQALTGENIKKGLFFKIFDKIKGVRLEVTNWYSKPRNKVLHNVFCVD